MAVKIQSKGLYYSKSVACTTLSMYVHWGGFIGVVKELLSPAKYSVAVCLGKSPATNSPNRRQEQGEMFLIS